MTHSISDTLEERGKRYGEFLGHAVITQRLKFVLESELERRSKVLDADQQEALDMICHKIGRIINGDADYIDSWHDIAGYAKLVEDRLYKEQNNATQKVVSGRIGAIDGARVLRSLDITSNDIPAVPDTNFSDD